MTYEELIDKFTGGKIVRAVLSKPVKDALKSGLKLRPVTVKGKILYQVTSVIGKKTNNTYKEIHENYTAAELKPLLLSMIPDMFLQGLFETEDEGYTVLAGKRGTVTVVKNKTISAVKRETGHNRTKNYLIPEDEPVPIMVELGVMKKDGGVIAQKYDKFKQINRYLEFVNDILPRFEGKDKITIIDFGCGKSYLTFALYHFLVTKKKMNVHIIGLDLKSDVIAECNRLKNKYRYDSLEFIEGDIEHFAGVESVDMVFSLHACDTATDYAIYKAVIWGADVIMAVPCCQHELNKKIDSPSLRGVTDYGILKDRLAAVMTDAMRANTLKAIGYDTDILEFIDMEHTPKNLLIRAVKRTSMRKVDPSKERLLEETAGADITLVRLLSESGRL